MIAVRTLLCLIFCCFMFVTAAVAETAPAFVKTELKKNEKIWPGQRQTLYVKLYTGISFSGSTRFELPKVSGMLIMEGEDRPLLGTEEINGASYIYKQHEISLFPQRAGSLTVPPFGVEFGFRGPEGKISKQSFTTKELQFTVGKIPGADPESPVITSSKLTIDDHWEPAPEKAKVGDAFIRTISMTAEDLPGMAFPPLNIQKIEGLGVYKKQPQVADQRQRGEFTGKRTETISYICEKAGTFTVPAAHIQWWNPKKESLQKIVLKGVELNVAPNPLLEKESPVKSDTNTENRISWKRLLAIFIFFVLVGVLFVWLLRRIKQRRSPVPDLEKELFKKFQMTSASGNAAATMQTLLHWLDYNSFTGNTGSLARFVKLADDPELSRQVEDLEKIMYAGGKKQIWSGDVLYDKVQRARKKLKQHKFHGVQHSLPAVNP